MLRSHHAVVVGKQYLLIPGTPAIYGLNDTGRAIWKLLEKGTDLEEIVKTIQKKFGGTESLIRRDAKTFLATLRKNGLLERSE